MSGKEIKERVTRWQASVYNGRYDPPEIAQLPVMISSDQGTLAELELPLSNFGGAHGSYTLPEDATPGYYQIGSPELTYSNVPFQVANYRKPEVNLVVSYDQDSILAGERLSAKVEARYFFDAPAGNLPVRWTLHKQDSHFRLPGYRVLKTNHRGIELIRPRSLNHLCQSLHDVERRSLARLRDQPGIGWDHLSAGGFKQVLPHLTQGLLVLGYCQPEPSHAGTSLADHTIGGHGHFAAILVEVEHD